MSKVFVFAVFLIICAILIAGCGSQTATTTSPGTTGPTTTTTTQAPATTTSTGPSQTTTTKPPTTTTTAKPTTTTTGGPKTGGTLRIILIAGPQNAGGLPAEVFGPDATSYQFCLEPLLRGDNKGGFVPWLAESYKVADDLKSITFNLRKGVKFHDGTDFNAQAAKWNLDQQIQAKTMPFWTSIDIIDDSTIRVNLSLWTNTAVNNFADSNYSWMISPTAFQKNGKDWARSNPVGTGPFKFASFEKDVSFKVVKNPTYWQTGKPYLDGIEILYVGDPTTQRAAMLSGAADMLELEPGQTAIDLKSQGFDYYQGLIVTYCLLPDSGHPDSPYAKQGVRQAVEQAINREAIAKAFGYGFWTAAYQVPSPANPAYNPNFNLGRKFDPAAAKDLLAAAGYPSGFKTTLLANPAVPRNMIVAVQSFLNDVNIKADISFPPNMGGFMESSNSLNNVLVVQPILGGSNYNFALTQFLSGKTSFWNHNFQPSDAYFKLVDASQFAKTYDASLARAATDQLIKDSSVVPFANAGLGFLVKPYVKAGWGQRATTEDLDSENIWLDK